MFIRISLVVEANTAMSDDDWRALLSQLVDDALTRDIEEPCERVRMLHGISTNCAISTLAGFTAQVTRQDVESKLDAGCYLEAAISLVGPRCEYLVERKRQGLTIVTMYPPGIDGNVTFSGSCEADAFMSALAISLWQLEVVATR